MTGERVPIYAPNTGQVFDYWQPMPGDALERALERADHALDALTLPGARRDILEVASAALVSRRETFIDLVVREVGKKPAEATAEFDYALAFLQEARRALDELTFERQLDAERLILEVPYRAALLIAPFNDPLAGLTRKIGPALAAGAPVLVKPSRLAILCARLIVESFSHAGIGDFVQLVAPARNETVLALIADDRVGVVSFTGSTGAGQQVATAAAHHGKKAILELGGNCPFVIGEDADLDRSLADLLARKLRAAGQACSSVNRVFVAASRYGEFKERLAASIERVRAGPSDGADVDLGPLRTREAIDQLRTALARARQQGEQLWSEAPAPCLPNSPFLFPLTVAETEGESFFDTYECFGPVLSVRPFDAFDALLSRLERERHALVAYFYVADPHALAPKLRRLRFGSLGLNSTAIQGADVPTGGFWHAGIGREGGAWGVREFLAPINHRIERG